MWNTHGALLAGGGSGALLLLAAGWLLARARRRARWAHGARWIEITAPPQADPHGAELLWATLDGLRRAPWRRVLFGQPHLALELHGIGHQLRIGVWVAGGIPAHKVERAIRAAWPGARTTTTPVRTDPATQNESSGAELGQVEVPVPLPQPGPGRRIEIAAGRIHLARHQALPLHSGPHAGGDPAAGKADPLRAVLGALTELPDHHTGCVQILARPTGRRRTHTARRGATRLLAGQTTSVPAILLGLARTVLVTVPLAILSTSPRAPHTRPANPGSHPSTRPPRPSVGGAGDPRVRAAVRGKLGAGPLWSVQIRYAATITIATTDIPDPGPRHHHQQQLRRAASRRECVGRADTLGGAFAAYTHHNRPARARLYRHTAMRHRWMGTGQILSVGELAALAHLPLDPRASGMTRAGAARVNPPPQLPTGGPGTKALGHAAASGRPVAVTVEALRGHLHIQGQTGTGKSTTIANLVLADIAADRAIVLAEPKGDLSRDIQARIPADKHHKLVLLDPDSPGAPPVLNLLDPHHPAGVEHLIGIFSRLNTHWGHRLEQALRVACLTEIAHYHHRARLDPDTRHPHLGDVCELFLDDAHRHRATAALTGPQHRYLRGWWASYHQQSPAAREQHVGPLVNRLLALLLRPFPRAVLTGDGRSLNIADVIDNGGICIARLPEGTLEPDTVSLLGSLLVARTWHAATARAALPEDRRPDATLYLDEAQQFLHMPHSLESLLARARAYRLSLVLAHQNLDQLKTGELKAAISTNTLSKLYFRSPEDAPALERHVWPQLGAHDIAHLDAYTAAARLHHQGADTPAFTLATPPLPPLPTPLTTARTRQQA